MSVTTRREFLGGLGSAVGTLSLAGCVGNPLPNSRREPDLTVFVGAYHWGFIVVDETGTERESLVLDPGTRVRLVAFNTGADSAIARLPSAIQSALPDHEDLERRNEDRIPTPPSRDLHAALEEANDRYPDHSVAVMPSGYNHMRGPMDGGMMLHPIPLPHDAQRPAEVGLVASERGDYTISCLTDCGYGHPYMEIDGAFVVR